ncbi:hypothetical protein [Desulfatirhabdium butyrativorans]|uniref:hypothetical protein n=1 Tax=Desulfatirhabdium butyrativorans TaxID=340467 RepID=UPI0003F6D75A|nr:hypothetical protein [Desulfatirhabdium butyrativorans]
MSRPVSQENLQDTLSLIEKAILKANEPLDIDRILSDIPVAFRVDAGTAMKLLDQLTQSGKIFSWKPKSRSKAPRFWKVGDIQHCRQDILSLIGPKPLTDRELQKKLRSRLFGLPAAMVQSVVKHSLSGLIAEKRLFRHPPLRARMLPRYGASPVDPAPYLKRLRSEFERVMKLFQNSGIEAADILKTLARSIDPGLLETIGINVLIPGPASAPIEEGPPRKTLSDWCDQVLQVIDTRFPGAKNSLPIWLPELRGYAGLAKPEFDRAIVQLARSGKLHLDRHNHPGSLDEKSREPFVQDEAGVSYVVAVLK